MKKIDDLIKKAKSLGPSKMAVACAADFPVLEAIELARKENIIEAVLVGDKEKIVEMLKDNAKHYEIIDIKDPVLACEEAVKLVSSKKCNVLMKGLVDTSVILKAVLNKEFGLRTKNRLSHVTLMESSFYHKLFLMSDGAMNMYPDAALKQEILENGVDILNKVGIKNPKVGCICAIEKINPKMIHTLDCQELVDKNKNNEIKDCIVGGPYALDNAINKEAAIHKGIDDGIAGDVDFLLMPQIEAGNVFYKTMMFLADAKSASVVAGATNPIVLTSRADEIETKYNSIAFAALIAKDLL